MLILANRWRGSPPLLFLSVYKLMLFSVLTEAKPQKVVSLVEDQISVPKSNSQVTGDALAVSRVTPNPLVSKSFERKDADIQDSVMLDFFRESSLEVHEDIPLNFTMFSFPPQVANSVGRRNIHIPRYMMEYFAQNTHQSRRLPEGATIARSFFVHSIEMEEEDGGSKLEETSGHRDPSPAGLPTFLYMKSGPEVFNDTLHSEKTHESLSDVKGVTKPYSQHHPSWKSRTRHHNHDNDVVYNHYYKFAFNLTLPTDEVFHSALLRVFVQIRRGVHDIAGVERRIRVYVSSSDSESKPKRTNGKLPIVQKDIYLFNSAWSQIDISHAVILPKQHTRRIFQTIDVEISENFYVVGGKGEFELHTGLESALRPFVLVFSSRNDSRRKTAMDQSFSFRMKRSLSVAELEEEETNTIWEGMSSPVWSVSSLADERKLGKKARRRRAKNACKRKPLKIVFKDIGWDHWIIAPQSYEAYQCSGKCFYPLASHLTPTKHAVVQNLVHSLQPDLASRACCVPTKLGPISLLYLESGIPTYNYDYSEMVVLECGCR